MEKITQTTNEHHYALTANGVEYMYFDIPSLIEGIITHVGLNRAEIAELKRTFN